MTLLLGAVSSLQVDTFANRGIRFVENAAADHEYAVHTVLPTNFGSGEFTLKVVITPSQVSTIGQTATGAGRVENWSNENATLYGAADWWFLGNFLLDGHNNASFEDGTCSLQVFNSGRVRWTFGDGAAAGARTGDLHGIQNPTGVNILDGGRHIIHCVREFTGASDSTLRLYVDGVEQDTETSTARTNMYTTYWQNWTGFPVGGAQNGWFWGAEKQAALGDTYADYKGLLEEVAFYSDALSAAEVSADQGPVDTGHVDYMDHFAFDEGTGSPQSANSITMTLNNEQIEGFWP